MGVSLCVPVVPVTVGLAVPDGVAEVEVDEPSGEVGSPGWEITLHVEHEIPGADRGDHKGIGVGKSFSWVGLHGGIAVISIKGDLATPEM